MSPLQQHSTFQSSRRSRHNTPASSADASDEVSLPATLLAAAGAGYVAYEHYQPFRHTVLAVVRCSRVAGASRCPCARGRR